MANYVKMMAVAITAAQRADAKAKQLRRNFCKYCFENWDVSVKILTFVDSLHGSSILILSYSWLLTQFWKMNLDHLLNKPYVNEVTLT